MNYNKEWDKLLSYSSIFWKKISGSAIPFNETAPISYDPKNLCIYSLGKYLIQIILPNTSRKKDRYITYDNLKKGIIGSGLEHLIKNKLKDDPYNPDLVIIANQFPKLPYQSMLVTKEKIPQVENEIYLKSQFAWASENFIVEFHRKYNILNHYHFHIYPTDKVPLCKFFNSFKTKYEIEGMSFGKLDGYPIPHFAITSKNVRKLIKIIVIAHKKIEKIGVFLNHDIFKTKNGQFVILFFVQNNYIFPTGFGVNTLGIISSTSILYSEKEAMEQINKRHMPQEYQDKMSTQIFEEWK